MKIKKQIILLGEGVKLMAWGYELIEDKNEYNHVFYCDNCNTKLYTLKKEDEYTLRYLGCAYCGYEYKADYKIDQKPVETYDVGEKRN